MLAIRAKIPYLPIVRYMFGIEFVPHCLSLFLCINQSVPETFPADTRFFICTHYTGIVGAGGIPVPGGSYEEKNTACNRP